VKLQKAFAVKMNFSEFQKIKMLGDVYDFVADSQ
jgi:acyl carrier protein